MGSHTCVAVSCVYNHLQINAKYAGTRILVLVRYNSVVPLCSPNKCKEVFNPNVLHFSQIVQRVS